MYSSCDSPLSRRLTNLSILIPSVSLTKLIFAKILLEFGADLIAEKKHGQTPRIHNPEKTFVRSPGTTTMYGVRVASCNDVKRNDIQAAFSPIDDEGSPPPRISETLLLTALAYSLDPCSRVAWQTEF